MDIGHNSVFTLFNIANVDFNIPSEDKTIGSEDNNPVNISESPLLSISFTTVHRYIPS